MKKVIEEIREFIGDFPGGGNVGISQSKTQIPPGDNLNRLSPEPYVSDFNIVGNTMIRIARVVLSTQKDLSQVLISMRCEVLPDNFYIEINRLFSELRIRRIRLATIGWDLIPEPDYEIADVEDTNEAAKPKLGYLINSMRVRNIRDHVGCRLPSPLTKSQSASSGKAFIDMKDAYEYARSPNDIGLPDELINRLELLWHTEETEKMSDEEIRVAREAGCGTASPYVVPWVVCARAFGMKISAMVDCTDNNSFPG